VVPVTVAALVLAAGAGSRYGAPKALVELDGERLVDRAIRVLRQGGIIPTYVVQGAAVLTDLSGAEVVDNPDWPSGMGSSLRAGISALPAAVQAVVVVPVDQPGLTTAALRRVLAAAQGDRQQALVVATYAGRRGHPVLLGRRHWAGVAGAAVGDTGARAYLATRPDVVEVECADVASGVDVDEPADLDRFRTTRA
jgi:CTP:molybdopterin cytidylyltransferase MocA